MTTEEQIKKQQKLAYGGIGLVVVGLLLAIVVLVAGGMENATSSIGFLIGLIALVLGVVIVFLANGKVKKLRSGQ